MAKAKPAPRALPSIPTRPTSGAVISTGWGQAVHDVVFGLASAPDVRDGWLQNDIPANLARVDMLRGDGTLAPLAGFNGAIIGMYWRKTGAISAGTITLQAQSGSTVSEDVVLNSASSTTGTQIFAVPITFSRGTAIRVTIASAGLSPTTVDMSGVGLMVRYDYMTSGLL